VSDAGFESYDFAAPAAQRGIGSFAHAPAGRGFQTFSLCAVCPGPGAPGCCQISQVPSYLVRAELRQLEAERDQVRDEIQRLKRRLPAHVAHAMRRRRRRPFARRLSLRRFRHKPPPQETT
jgi:hypothetical protein